MPLALHFSKHEQRHSQVLTTSSTSLDLASIDVSMGFCGDCGTHLPADLTGRFCPECGAS